MSEISSPFSIEVVRRGYDRDQVDARIAQLTRDGDAARTRIATLEQRVEELIAQAKTAQTEIIDAEPAYLGLGPRVEKILHLAEEEADDLVEQARDDAAQHQQAARDAAKLKRDEADTFAIELKAANSEACARIIEEAEALADEVRTEADSDAQAARAAGNSFFEDTRIRAAQAAADFEGNLTKRREQAERDLAARQAKAEARLSEIEQRAEKLRTEAERLRKEAERRALTTTQTARQQAEDIVADANAKAGRIRNDSEREIAALANRREAISAQLANVRAMLATLTGAAVSPATEPDDGTRTRPSAL